MTVLKLGHPPSSITFWSTPQTTCPLTHLRSNPIPLVGCIAIGGKDLSNLFKFNFRIIEFSSLSILGEASIFVWEWDFKYSNWLRYLAYYILLFYYISLFPNLPFGDINKYISQNYPFFLYLYRILKSYYFHQMLHYLPQKLKFKYIELQELLFYN